MSDNICQCDNCGKMFPEELTTFSAFESNGIGDTRQCIECTGQGEITTCDMCDQLRNSEFCRTTGDMWICEECEEHVLG